MKQAAHCPPFKFLDDKDFLDARAREIFRQIVENYLSEGGPIGSHNLSKRLAQPLSPATIRNVMSKLEQLGLITAPHISAGRLPTHSGLRFFIDSFMEISELKTTEKLLLQGQLQEAASQPLEDMLKDASQIVSQISQNAALIVTAKQDVKLKYIEFIRLEEERALVVLVTQNGDIENRIINLPKGINNSQLSEASNYLNSHILNRSLEEARLYIEANKEQTNSVLHKLSQELVDQGVALFGGKSFDQKMRLIIHGYGALLDNVKEKQDLRRVKQLFDDLETQEIMGELLELTSKGPGVCIFIGAENKLFSLSESSLIVAPYQDAKENIIGAVGVIGPTYVNYARIIPIVNYTAQFISDFLK